MDDQEGLLKSVAKESEFFSSVIDFIPPEHYGYDDDTKEILRGHKHSLVDGKLTPAQREKLSNKMKGRLAKLDDRQCRTNSQISEFLLATLKGKKRKTTESDQSNPRPQPNKKARLDKKKIESNGPAPVGDRQRLLSKLQAKLDELRAKRGSQLAPASKGLDHEEKKRLKRKLSKAKMRDRRRQEREQKPGQDGSKAQDQKPKPSMVSPSTAMKALANTSIPKQPEFKPTTVSPLKKKSKLNQAAEVSSTKKPALVDKEGNMVFSKFDFAVPGVAKEEPQSKWSKKKSGKDYKGLLEKQTRFEEKVQRLEDQNDVEGAKKLKQKSNWEAATERARGGKVKDDPNLLKKGLKRKEKRKQQAKRKWDTRKEAVQHKQQERQQKRKENIQAKRKEKKDKKLAKARKKGRLV